MASLPYSSHVFYLASGSPALIPSHTCGIEVVSVHETGKQNCPVGIGSQIGAAIAPLIIVPIAVAYGWRMPFSLSVQ
jgi:hypothetical protein